MITHVKIQSRSCLTISNFGERRELVADPAAQHLPKVDATIFLAYNQLLLSDQTGNMSTEEQAASVEEKQGEPSTPQSLEAKKKWCIAQVMNTPDL